MGVRRRRFNTDFFDNIDCEKKAYVLGFLCSDGYICGTNGTICFYSNDVEILEKISSAFEFENPKFIERSQGKCGYKTDKINYELRLNSVHMKRTLLKLLKSNTKDGRKFPDLEKYLYRHFIRGYFDGDGSISKRSDRKIGHILRLSGRKDFLNSIGKLMTNELDLKPKKPHSDKTIYALSYSDFKEVNKIYDYLYNNAEIYLSRKKEKFNRLLNQAM